MRRPRGVRCRECVSDERRAEKEGRDVAEARETAPNLKSAETRPKPDAHAAPPFQTPEGQGHQPFLHAQISSNAAHTQTHKKHLPFHSHPARRRLRVPRSDLRPPLRARLAPARRLHLPLSPPPPLPRPRPRPPVPGGAATIVAAVVIHVPPKQAPPQRPRHGAQVHEVAVAAPGAGAFLVLAAGGLRGMEKRGV